MRKILIVLLLTAMVWLPALAQTSEEASVAPTPVHSKVVKKTQKTRSKKAKTAKAKSEKSRKKTKKKSKDKSKKAKEDSADQLGSEIDHKAVTLDLEGK